MSEQQLMWNCFMLSVPSLLQSSIKTERVPHHCILFSSLCWVPQSVTNTHVPVGVLGSWLTYHNPQSNWRVEGFQTSLSQPHSPDEGQPFDLRAGAVPSNQWAKRLKCNYLCVEASPPQALFREKRKSTTVKASLVLRGLQAGLHTYQVRCLSTHPCSRIFSMKTLLIQSSTLSSCLSL